MAKKMIGPSMVMANKILKIDESKLDRYLQYYNNEIGRSFDETNPKRQHLTPTEQDMLKKYERVYELFDLGNTDSMIRTVLKTNYEIQDRQARYIIEEARIIYGLTGKADKEGQKQASINYYRLLSNIARKLKDPLAAGRLWEKADRMAGLFDEEGIGFDPKDFEKPTQVIYTNNVNILNKTNKRIAEDE
jgi:hypothetical protein